jgi:hypothetical protein
MFHTTGDNTMKMFRAGMLALGPFLLMPLVTRAYQSPQQASNINIKSDLTTDATHVTSFGWRGVTVYKTIPELSPVLEKTSLPRNISDRISHLHTNGPHPIATLLN